MRVPLSRRRYILIFRYHRQYRRQCRRYFGGMELILGDPGAVSGGEGKSKRAEKYGTKKSKERREESLGTMSYQTSSKRSPPFCLLISARKLLRFSDKFQNFSILLAPLRKYEEKSLGRGPYLFSHLALSCFCFCLFFCFL